MPQPRSKTKAKPKAKPAVIGEIPATSQALTTTVAPDTPAEVWRALDAADEEQIIAELVTGTLVDKLAYEFEAGGKTVRGISYEGINWCVREMAFRGMGAIGLKGESPEQAVRLYEGADPDGNPVYKALVLAKCTFGNGAVTEAAGMADALRFPKAKSGGTYTDLMAERKAVSKAQRNAKNALVPALLKAELLANVTSAQLQLVQTSRQRAEIEAAAAGGRRVAATTAKKPAAKQSVPANAQQQKLMFAKFKEGGGPALAQQMGIGQDALQRVLFGWGAGQIHADRIPKDKVDDVIAVMADPEGAIAELTECFAKDGTEIPTQLARWVAREVPELGKVLAPPVPEAGGEQTTLQT